MVPLPKRSTFHPRDRPTFCCFYVSPEESRKDNTKIMVWRLELGQLNYSIRHRSGKDNVAPDAMPRMCSSTSSVSQLLLLHDRLGQSGFARMYRFIRSRNLPYTSEETKDIIDKCLTCLQLKPILTRTAISC